MKTLIAYSSKHGCTEACARMLAEHLDGKVDRLNLKEFFDVDLSPYDTVVLGSPIYVGQILKEVDRFATNNEPELLEKTLGLFICSMQEEHTVKEELAVNYPEELQEKAVAKEWFGGAYDFSDMNFIERLIIKKAAKTDQDVSNIRKEAIIQFAETLNRQ